MHQINDANASYQTANRATVLPFDQLDEARIPLVLHTVIKNQARL